VDIISMVASWLDAKELDITGIALSGSHAKGDGHKASDYDVLVLSTSPRCFH
jgi:predicted nucleotidyltransferase